MTLALRKARFAAMHATARLAMIAASGARLLPIYEQRWVGDHAPAVARAIELGWASATGAAIDPDEAQTVERHVAEQVAFLREEDIAILADPVTIALRVIEAVRAESDEASVLAAARAIGNHLSVGRSIDTATAHAPRVETADAEERRWIDAAFALAESQPVSRALFDALGPPSWWPAYEASPTPLV